MDVLEAVENETLESHASVREKRQRQATLLLFAKKVQERSGPVSQVWEGRSQESTCYELRVETGDIRPVLSLLRWKSGRIPGTAFVICSNKAETNKGKT